MHDTNLPPGCTQADIDRAATSTELERLGGLPDRDFGLIEPNFLDRVKHDLTLSVLEVIEGSDPGGDSLVLWLTRELGAAASAEGVTL